MLSFSTASKVGLSMDSLLVPSFLAQSLYSYLVPNMKVTAFFQYQVYDFLYQN